jgi:hypothetical protein
MSLKPQPVCPVPQETARVARAAYPKGNLSMQMRDVVGTIFTDKDFADLFPKEGQPTDRAMAIGLGDRDAMCGEPVRSASGRCGAWKDRLEIPSELGTHGCGM